MSIVARVFSIYYNRRTAGIRILGLFLVNTDITPVLCKDLLNSSDYVIPAAIKYIFKKKRKEKGVTIHDDDDFYVILVTTPVQRPSEHCRSPSPFFFFFSFFFFSPFFVLFFLSFFPPIARESKKNIRNTDWSDRMY